MGNGCTSNSNIALISTLEEIGTSTITPVPFSCKLGTRLRDPSVYGLETFNITVTVDKITESEYDTFITFTLTGGVPYNVVVKITVTGTTLLVSRISGESLNIKVTTFFRTVTITVISPEDPEEKAIYGIEFALQGVEIVIAGADIAPGEDNLSLPSSPSGDLPNIRGRIYVTQDGEQICQTTYLVSTEHEEQLYKQYCVDIATYLKCKGPTVQEKVTCLQEKGYKVDFELVVTYSILRIILSSIVFCKPFNPVFLERKYYEDFLKRLACSEWNAFLAFFIDPQYGVVNYWKLFV